MEEQFPMMNPMHGALGRLLSTRLPARMTVRMSALMAALLLAACATPPGSVPDAGSPAVPVVSAGSAVPPAAITASAPVAAAASAPPVTEAIVVPVPVDPLRPDVPVILDERTAQADLWARVRRGFAMPDLDTDLVHVSEQWYATRPDYVQRMTERGGRYMFHIVEELERRNMPTELALLPFVESAFNPQAMSTAKASGMWQFMPGTGKTFALKQNVFRDDRRDILASTRAALDYLQKLHDMFGDWQLALAAYNWGEGNVQRAVARNQKLGLPTDYLSLKMPNETAYYVPKLQAVKNIIAHPADFGLALPELKNHPYFLSVPIDRDMDVAVAVKLANVPLAEFQTLNPQMNKPVILAAGTPQVLLPYDNADHFIRALPLHRGPLASWTAWTVPQTMRSAEAARRVGMSEAELREVNRIPPRMLVKAGSTLLVPRAAQRETDVPVEVADNATMALAPDAPPLRKISLKAGRRDSVASVAKRYRVAPAQVALWNGVGKGASFAPGQAIVVFVVNKVGRHGPHGAPDRRLVSTTRPARPSAAVHSASASPRPAAPRHGHVRVARN
jgi:membrane-bound lytic murein transglycosylase D